MGSVRLTSLELYTFVDNISYQLRCVSLVGNLGYQQQEFLQKNPVAAEKKTGIPATSPKPRSCEKFLRKTQEKKGTLTNPGIPENRN